MTYNPKFDYHPITRSELNGKRLYLTPNGEKVPSVTTILDKTKSKEKVESLTAWRMKKGAKLATQITTEAAARGTRMHSYLEHFIKTGTVKDRGTNPYGWASHHMANTIIDKGLANVSEFWGVEIPLYFPQIYAGTTDGVGIHLGEESILDYKQTNKPKKREWIDDYFIQLVAYALAHNEVYGTNIKKGVVLMCVKPDVDLTGEVTTQAQYQEFILEGEEFEKYSQLWWSRLEQYYILFG